MFVRVSAVAAKEFWALVRQPQLLLLLLLGPVVIMAVFALGFRTEYAKPSAVVVVPPGSEGAELFERFRQRIVSHVDFRGTVGSVEAADRLIRSGEVDGAIVVPADPAAAVADDERAVIGARYSAIHPIHGQTVPNRARGILFDLNDAIVREGIERRLGDARSAREKVAELDRRLERASGAAEDLASEEAKETTAGLDAALSAVEGSLEVLQGTPYGPWGSVGGGDVSERS